MGVNSADIDEVAHFEPPHEDLCCLQIQLLSSVVLKELNGHASNSQIHAISAFHLSFFQQCWCFTFQMLLLKMFTLFQA